MRYGNYLFQEDVEVQDLEISRDLNPSREILHIAPGTMEVLSEKEAEYLRAVGINLTCLDGQEIPTDIIMEFLNRKRIDETNRMIFKRNTLLNKAINKVLGKKPWHTVLQK